MGYATQEDIIALSRVKPYNPAKNGQKGVLYLDTSTVGVVKGWVWDTTNLVYILVFDSSQSGALNFRGLFSGQDNTPALNTITKQKNDFWVVSSANASLSPTLTGGITSVGIGDWLIWTGTLFVKVPTPLGINPPQIVSTSITTSTLNCTYIVNDTTGNLTLTVPISQTSNAGNYITIVKSNETTNKITVRPTSPQTFNSDAFYELYIKNDSITLRSSANPAIGWILESESRDSNPVRYVELSSTGQAVPAKTNNNWLIQPSGSKLEFKRYLNGTAETISSIGQSVTTDNFKISTPAGALQFVDASNNTNTIVKPSIDGTGGVLGNPLGRVAFLNNGELLDVKFDQVESTNIINADTGATQSGNMLEYQFKSSRVQAVISASINVPTAPADTRVRFEVVAMNGNVLAESVTVFDFHSPDVKGGQLLVDGVNVLMLMEELALSLGFDFKVKFYFGTFVGDVFTPATVTLTGSQKDLNDGLGLRFVPTTTEKYQQGYEYNVAHSGNIKTIIESFTGTNRINNNSFSRNVFKFTNPTETINTLVLAKQYTNSTMIFTATGNNGLIISDSSLFNIGDTIIAGAYNTDGVSTCNLLITPTGATIEDVSTLTVEKNEFVTIQKTSASNWTIISRFNPLDSHVTSASFNQNTITLVQNGITPNVTATMPIATASANGALSSADKVILNKLATPDVNNDLVNAVAKSGTTDTVTFTRRVGTTFDVSISGASYQPPVVCNMTIPYPSRINSYDDLVVANGVGTVDITFANKISGMVSFKVGSASLVSFTPVDGKNTFTFTLTEAIKNAIQTAGTNPVVFNLVYTDTNSVAHTVSLNVNVQAFATSDFIYYGNSSVNTSIDPTTLADKTLIVSGQKDYLDYSISTWSGNKFFCVAHPTSMTLNDLFIGGLSQLGGFSAPITTTVNSVTYNLVFSNNQINIGGNELKIRF